MKKTAVFLIQLGTPDSPKLSDVRRYLSQFLNDPRVIDVPWLLRKILVNLIIVPFRAPKSSKVYKELWDLGKGISPLMTHTENLKAKLEQKFDKENVHFFMAMRYQNPSIEDVLREVQSGYFDQIILLPLFPQYASASTGSAIEAFMDAVRKWWVIPEIKIINQFYENEGYLNTQILLGKEEMKADTYDHVIFSYHGLPERQVDKVYIGSNDLCGDQPCETEINEKNKFCYKATCYATTRLIAEKLGLKKGDYTVAFQSRLDRKWLRPFSDEVVVQRAKKGDKKLLIFSPAFVADCLETLIEIGQEYQEIFEQYGGEKVRLVPSCNDHPLFVDGLEQEIRARL
jgi:ferrochelatase